MIEALQEEFKKIFDQFTETRSFFAPGRVNLIGEHTDYNGGYVFPCSLSIGTYAIARKRNDKTFRLYSKNFSEKGTIQFSLDSLIYDDKHDWANYPKAVIEALVKEEYVIDKGCDILFYGDIPSGGGLSSSASIELVTAVAIKSLFDLDMDMISLVKLCQKAENQFIGVSCGIMDQFAIGMGKRDHAILLDCNTLEYSYSRINLEDSKILIVNSNKQRGLKDSKYNQRRDECNRALSMFKKALDINSLGEMTVEDFEKYKHLINDEISMKRAKHVVYENDRTIRAVEVLKKEKLKDFGILMNESHVSLRDDYDVTGKELDTLVELAWKQKGVIGARMTGAGFGGCTVNIVKNDSIDSFRVAIKEKYKELIGYEPSFYIVEIGDGVREL